MVLTNNKLILIFGFENKDINKIKDLLKKNNLPKCKLIEATMTKMKLRDIIDGLRFSVLADKMMDEELILFNNLEDSELEKCIDIFKNNLDSNPIFAAVTPTSIEWTFEELMEHLIEERRWIKEQGYS